MTRQCGCSIIIDKIHHFYVIWGERMVERFEKFSYVISEISRYWHKIATDEMAKYELKGAHAVYLTVLYHHPDGIPATQLCELCGKDKADASRMISILERRGLVERSAPAAYRAPVRLTDEGHRAASHVVERVRLVVELAGGDISDEDRRVFYATLEHIADKLHGISRTGLPTEPCEAAQ